MESRGRLNLLQTAIFNTLCYADIFDYPLKKEELYQFLIGKSSFGFSSFGKELKRLKVDFKKIGTIKGYFFLKGRSDLVGLREKREKWSQEKTKIAFQVAERLKFIPWLKMIGVTGALAMGNATEDDDIDFLIVTTRNRLWLTRILIIFLTEIWGVRRKPPVSSRPPPGLWRNKICLNLFLDENNLVLPEKARNLYTAHEVCQVKLVWDKDNIFKQFLWQNQWAREYLPNGTPNFKFKISNFKLEKQNIFFNFLEKIAYKFQLAYMKSKRTIEKVEPGRVLFHPEDCLGWVMKEYYDRVKERESGRV